MIASLAFHAGLVLVLTGVLVAVIRLPALRLDRRAHGVVLIGLGLLVAGSAVLWPATETYVDPPRTRLDALLPSYQFAEHHEIAVAAPPARVYQALREVSAADIRFFRFLTWIRRAGRGGPESILNAPWDDPLLDVATRTTFALLVDEREREVVIGTLVIAPQDVDLPNTAAAFTSLRRPGIAKAALNFTLEPDGAGGTRVSTDTRVFATDARTRRRFAAYWRFILPGSALIRRSWLAAVRTRAERQGASVSERQRRDPRNPS